MRNGATSNNQALQAQFHHRLAHGLQTLFSYTWAHSIDDVSSDVYFANVPPGVAPSSGDRGSSDYDIRHTFAGAVSYDIRGPGSGMWKSILGNWSTDSIIYARSATPVNVVTGKNPFPGTFLSGASGVQRPNVIPGVPFYLDESGEPGGKIINAAAFSLPTTSVQGDLGRNALRGFGATQIDLTLRRQFRFTERFSLQARGDLFNIFNHPNFGNPQNYLYSSPGKANPLFGQSTQNAGQLPWQRRPERRPQPSLPNRRPALDPTGAQAAVLGRLVARSSWFELEARSEPPRSDRLSLTCPQLADL